VDEQEFRSCVAALALQGVLAGGITHEHAADFAIEHADRLLKLLGKVPAPPGGPVASPPGSDSPPTVQDVTSTKGAASAHAEQRARGGEPGRVGGGSEPSDGGQSASFRTAGNPARLSPLSGAASLHAGEDAAAQVAPPGDLAPPPSATAGENPARSFSRKAKPGTPCGGPSCRDSITNWIHDPRTCPLYAGKRSA
jgi:hypothetical protein